MGVGIFHWLNPSGRAMAWGIKIRQVGAEFFHADGRTDTTKMIVAFRNVAKFSCYVFLNTVYLRSLESRCCVYELSLRMADFQWISLKCLKCCDQN
jgi:hypothetical protein